MLSKQTFVRGTKTAIGWALLMAAEVANAESGKLGQSDFEATFREKLKCARARQADCPAAAKTENRMLEALKVRGAIQAFDVHMRAGKRDEALDELRGGMALLIRLSNKGKDPVVFRENLTSLTDIATRFSAAGRHEEADRIFSLNRNVTTAARDEVPATNAGSAHFRVLRFVVAAEKSEQSWADSLADRASEARLAGDVAQADLLGEQAVDAYSQALYWAQRGKPLNSEGLTSQLPEGRMMEHGLRKADELMHMRRFKDAAAAYSYVATIAGTRRPPNTSRGPGVMVLTNPEFLLVARAGLANAQHAMGDTRGARRMIATLEADLVELKREARLTHYHRARIRHAAAVIGSGSVADATAQWAAAARDGRLSISDEVFRQSLRRQ